MQVILRSLAVKRRKSRGTGEQQSELKFKGLTFLPQRSERFENAYMIQKSCQYWESVKIQERQE